MSWTLSEYLAFPKTNIKQHVCPVKVSDGLYKV